MIERACEVSLSSSSHRPPSLILTAIALALNETRHEESVTCTLYRLVIALTCQYYCAFFFDGLLMILFICYCLLVVVQLIDMFCRCLSNFAVVLSKCPSAGKDRSSIGSNFTRTFGPVPIDHKKTIKNVLACERIHPSDEFTIVAKFYLPSFTDMQENYMCSAAVIAAVHEQTQNSGSRNYCIDDIMIFNAAKVNLTATEVFANSCAINLKSWNDSITGNFLIHSRIRDFLSP